MSRLSILLAVVLAAQLVVALLLSSKYDTSFDAFKSSEPLFAFDADTIERIEIADAKGNVAILEKKDDAWLIPEFVNFPADDGKVKGILSRFEKLDKGWPVATTASARDRFEVSQDNFVRRIKFVSGGTKTHTLYLGSSPAIRQAHVRPSNDDSIYTVSLSAFELPSENRDWSDAGLLALKDKDIQRITFPDFSIERKDDTWKLADLKPEESVKEVVLSRIVRSIMAPGFDSVVGKGKEALKKVETADFQVVADRKNGKAALTYKFKKQAGDGAVFLYSRSDLPYVFRTIEGRIEPIVSAKRSLLLDKDKATKKPTAAP